MTADGNPDNVRAAFNMYSGHPARRECDFFWSMADVGDSP
jgi:hypothetical protein